ncbi:MAG: hypothetical protein JJE04_25985 [Acidobacteriia bacterium]|nr:hypothetical protein [Terriglobia bacterium]
MKQDAENARMAKLYREVVLKETHPDGFVSISNIAPAKLGALGELDAVGGRLHAVVPTLRA